MNYLAWRESLKKEKRVRNYVHIDSVVDLDNEGNFKSVVKEIENIKFHQFLPFLRRIKKEVRYQRNGEMKPKKKIKKGLLCMLLTVIPTYIVISIIF